MVVVGGGGGVVEPAYILMFLSMFLWCLVFMEALSTLYGSLIQVLMWFERCILL